MSATTKTPRHQDEKRKLPAGWRWDKLKETGVFEAGGTPAKERTDYWNGEIPFVTGADITELCIAKANARAFLTRDGLYSGKTAVCETGTVLIVTRTRVGRAGITQETMGASQDITAFKCGPEIHQEFLCRYLHNISEHLIDNCRGATVQGLTREFVDNLEIPLPPLAEQRRITGVLREQMAAVDKARAAAQIRHESIKCLHDAYIRQVFDSDTAKNWPHIPIYKLIESGALLEHQDGNHGELHPRSYDFKSDGIKFLTAKHIKENGDLSFDSAPCISIEQAEGLRIGHAKGGDVLLAHNATVGPVGMAAIEQKSFIIGTSLTIYRSDEKYLLPRYLFWSLRSRSFQDQLREAKEQTTRNQVPITKQRTMFIKCPSIDSQHKIVDFLNKQMNTVDNARKSDETELQTINALPAALLRRAFSGEI